MNKILQINLGGYALTINDDAYQYLSAYLDSIRRRFADTEGRDEIVNDIETRLGELLTEEIKGRSIVALHDVEAAVEVMGKPEDFGADPIDGTKSHSSGSASGSGSGAPFIRPGKRLYRDEEDKVISGVCSGLAAYFGMPQAVWMRLIFVLLALISAGFWVPVYLLLVIIVHPARTSAERLAMRGEPINVDNIAKEFEQGYERIAKKAEGFGSGTRNFASNSASGCIYVLGKLAIAFLILVGVSMLLGLGSAWVAGIWAFFTAQPYLDYFSPLSTGWTYFGFFCLFLLLGLPVVSIVIWLATRMFNFRTPRWLSAGLGSLWGFSLVATVLLGVFGAQGYRYGGSATKNIDFSEMRSDTLRVEWASDRNPFFSEDDRYDRDDWWFDEDVRIGAEGLRVNGPLRIRVRKSTTGMIECTQTIRARGSSHLEATENASQSDFNVELAGNRLRVPTVFNIGKGRKWRGQEVRITIALPPGKSIVFDSKIYRYAAADLDEYADDNDHYYISRSPNQVFRMTSDGLACSACPQPGDREYESDRNYENFILEGDFKTEIRKGDKFSIQYEGPSSAIKVRRSGDKITFSTDGKKTNGAVKIILETPVFTSLHADNAGEVVIRDFEEGRSRISTKGASKIKGLFDCQNLKVLISGPGVVELNGEGGELEASLSEGATLDAANWRVSNAEISATDASKARVYATDRAKIKSDAGSTVKVDGGADTKGND